MQRLNQSSAGPSCPQKATPVVPKPKKEENTAVFSPPQHLDPPSETIEMNETMSIHVDAVTSTPAGDDDGWYLIYCYVLAYLNISKS